MADKFYHMKVIGGFRKRFGAVIRTECTLIWTEEPVKGENREQRQSI